MSIKVAFGNSCDVFHAEDVKDKFIDQSTAVQQFENRIDPENPVGGFLFSLSNLKKMIAEIDSFNENLNCNPDDPSDECIHFLRIWKGRSVSYKVQCTDDEVVHEVDGPHEDLMIMPVRKSGKDVYFDSNIPTIDVVEKTEDGTVVRVETFPLILSAPRPCPEWCGRRDSTTNKFRLFPVEQRYFHQRPEHSTTSTLGDPYEGKNPYAELCNQHNPI